MAASPLTTAQYRQVLAQFATGVTVVTAESGPGKVYGMTANSFTSVSLEPFLTLVCVDQDSGVLPLIQSKRRFGVSVLKEDQQAISEYFAQCEQNPEAEARLGIRYRWSPNGVPLLENTLAQLVCTVATSYIAGDHTIFLGEVQSTQIYEGEPLLYFRSEYRRIAAPR